MGRRFETRRRREGGGNVGSRPGSGRLNTGEGPHREGLGETITMAPRLRAPPSLGLGVPPTWRGGSGSRLFAPTSGMCGHEPTCPA